MRFPILVTLLSLLTALPAQQDPAPAALDLQQATSRLTEARARLEKLPAAPAPNSTDASLRQAWERRVTLLEEAIAQFQRATAQESAPANMSARRQTVETQTVQFEALPPVTVDESPTPAGAAELEAKVAALRQGVEAMRTEEADKARYVDSIPALLAENRSRLQSAIERSSSLSEQRDAATDPDQKEVLQIRAASAALDAEVARLETVALDRDRELEKSMGPLRTDERTFAELGLARAEQELQLYRQALGQAIDREAVRLDQELARLTDALATAQGPADTFVAHKRLAIARFSKNASEHGQFLLTLRSDLEVQERRLVDEVGELKSLKDYLDKAGTGAHTGERVLYTMKRVKLRRQVLDRTMRRDMAAELGVYRSRRFELEDELFLLKEAWQQQVDAVVAQLSGAAIDAFTTAAHDLFEPYDTALRQERDGLTDLIGVGQEFQTALVDRRRALGALENFIRSKAFWLRDSKPLGPDLWPRVEQEAEVVSAWAKNVAAPGDATTATPSVTRPGAVATLLLLLVALPIGLFWVRQRLRRFVTRMNDLTVQQDARPTHRLLAVGAGLISVALLPVFLFVASRSTDFAGLPTTLTPVIRRLLEFLAVTLLFWFMSRSFFAGRGTAQVQFGMPREAAHGLHRGLCVLLIGYLLFFSARSILSRPPFLLDSLPLEVLPRLAYTLFLATAVTASILLLQPRSAFSRYFGAALGDSFVGRRWPLVASLLGLVGVVIVALEIAGYRYSAGVLAENLALSLAALLVLVPLYKGVIVVLEFQARARRARQVQLSTEGQPEDGSTATAAANEGEILQLRTPVRVLFILGGLVLLANLWGLDSQTLDALNQSVAYDIRDTGEFDEFVSYGDLLRTLLYAMGTYLLLKYLPGLYEYGLFSRLQMDSGLKYAILTMSRYGIFTVGVLMVLSTIHLDLGRLGWLMAAMGVGLGFGLQEIVSNFVSGIILLVERPVRVGDIVTIGAVSGKIQRINIRATSVINFDRQEIIVPNRSLITKEVTNWTRGDTIIRLVVPIGVAYGSDIDQVTKTLLDIARQQPEILTDPAPSAFFLAHGESSLNFELRVFVPDPGVKNALLHTLNRAINRSLSEQGIEIPFPQRDLHIRSSTVPWPGKGEEGSS